MGNLYLREHHRFGDGFYPERRAESGRYLDVYYDQTVLDCKDNNKKIAVLLEPRSMIGEAYDYCMEHPGEFGYIFTHDSKLLTLPNARYLNWSNVWFTSDSVKNKGISLVSSWKNWCPLHNARIELARYFEHNPAVDVYGSYRDKDGWCDTDTAHEHYRFAIVIENDIDEYWFTEKILNCFSTKTVPIYVGATRIGDIFNADGIIQVHNWRMIPEIIRSLDVDLEYTKRQQAIEDNFCRAIPYTISWAERFMNDYDQILEDYLDGK